MQQSRNVSLFTHFNVPDTVNGRFESLTLHLFLILNKLRGNGGNYEEFAQEIIDHLVVKLDHALREEGVSDTKVAKRIKSMLTLFYGRIKAYDSAVERIELGKSDQQLVDFLGRTVFEKNLQPDEDSKRFEPYFQKAWHHIQQKSTDDILNNLLSDDEYGAILTDLKKTNISEEG